MPEEGHLMGHLCVLQCRYGNDAEALARAMNNAIAHVVLS
jgi:hypothetical protein